MHGETAAGKALSTLDARPELRDSITCWILTDFRTCNLTRRRILLVAFFLVSFIAVNGALFEYTAVVAEGGSSFRLLIWGAVFFASFTLLVMQIAGAAGDARQEFGIQDVIDSLPAGVALYDSAGNLRHRNESFLKAFPDSVIHGEGSTGMGVPELSAITEGEHELADGRWVRLCRRDLPDGSAAVTVLDISRLAALERELRAAGTQFHQLLSATADWVWETDVLHRFCVMKAVNPGAAIADFGWVIGRSLVELTGGGTDENGLAATSCMSDMDQHKRLRDVRLVLGMGRETASIRLNGAPRYDDKGEFLGYAGIGIRGGNVELREEMIERDIEPVRDEMAGRLLLVDDSATNRRLATTILNRMGYAVDDVDNGLKAVEAVRTGNYSAVLMDIWMPGMDGFAATAAIRELPSPIGELPVIAMTAHTGEEERRRCLDSGMDEHVGKPIDRAMLAAVLRRLAGPPPHAAHDGENHGDSPPSPATEELVSDDVLRQLRNDAGPSLVSELIAAFMSETDDRLLRIETAIAAGNFDDIGADAHSMKSSSGTFGALPLQELSARLEAAAMNCDMAAIVAVHDELPLAISETWREFAKRGYRRE